MMKERIFGAAIGAAASFAVTFGGPIAIGIGIGAIGSGVVHKIVEHHKIKNESTAEQEAPVTEEAAA